MTNEAAINQHYGEDILEDRVASLLKSEGLNRYDLAWEELSRFDQFHTGGLEATEKLADLLSIEPGSELLDVGSGLGGPARYLATTTGANVTGIDMNSAYIRIATDFSARSGLSGKTTFVEGNALRMPFSDESFDVVWTQHTAMNISDRDALYREFRRVLKPTGCLACQDIVLGTGEPLEFPFPWAATPDMNNIVSIHDMNLALQAAGFREVEWHDVTEDAKAFVVAQRAQQNNGNQTQPANLVALIGPQFAPLIQNAGRHFMDGRLRSIMTIQHPF